MVHGGGNVFLDLKAIMAPPPQLAAAISAHWIDRVNTMGWFACGHGCLLQSCAAQSKINFRFTCYQLIHYKIFDADVAFACLPRSP